MLYRFSIVGLALLALTACTTPFKDPVVEPLGLAYGADPSFPGIVDVIAKGDTRVLWVHGMCSHNRNWALQRYASLQTALDIQERTADPGEMPPNIFPRPEVRYGLVGSSRFDVSFLIWSDFSNPYKMRLWYDDSIEDGGEFRFKRASLNKTLKRSLINDCFSDAVVYGGANGNPIRDWMKIQVCHGLGGKYDGTECRFKTFVDTTQTVLIAESLGSKILFDTIRALWDASSSKEHQRRLSTRLVSMQLVFLAANQIPLLDAADQTVTGSMGRKSQDSVDFFIDILEEARGLLPRSILPSSQPHLVAFTDPNDLLSYRLTPEAVGAGIRVTNVIVSNDTTYFGLLERPDTAHCGYAWNPKVLGTILEGYHGGRIASLPNNQPKKCGW
jgi:hypothetical protein